MKKLYEGSRLVRTKNLTITYSGDPDGDLDQNIEGLMSRLGYSLYASGVNSVTNTRDLAYEITKNLPIGCDGCE